MDDRTALIHPAGGAEPGSDPHVCPLYTKGGAGKAACILMTSVFEKNRDACWTSKCNSAHRRCIMCLALLRSGRAIRYSSDPVTGLCWEHAEKGPQDANTRKPPVIAPTLAPVAKPEPPAPEQNATPPESISEAPEGIAKRFAAVSTSDPTRPTLHQIFDAVMALRDCLPTNQAVGKLFGMTATSAASWASSIAAMKRIKPEAWNVIDEIEATGERLPISRGLSLARGPENAQMATVEMWRSNGQ